MHFKKSFVVLFAVLFVPLAVASALGVIPHAHGKDFNHSQHENCPVHQLGSLAIDFDLSLFQKPERELLDQITNFEKISLSSKFFSFISLRAPPAPVL